MKFKEVKMTDKTTTKAWDNVTTRDQNSVEMTAQEIFDIVKKQIIVSFICRKIYSV